MKSRKQRRRLMAFAAFALMVLTGTDCGSTSDGGDTGTGGTGAGSNLTVNQACERWCTDESCVSIHFTQDFDTCMLGCTTEQHTSPDCDRSYADYIECLADAGCVAQCSADLLEWGYCENGDDGPGGGAESLTEVCQRGCDTAGCEGLFIGSGTQCLVTCLGPGDNGCETPYKNFMQCKADSSCSDTCRDEALTLSQCSQSR